MKRRQFLVGSAGALLACGVPRRHEADAREVERVVEAMATRDGAGVSLHRALGSPALPLLDPFLLLDQIRSADPNDFLAGFPEHPHRGFETVSYLLTGAFEHRDSVGNHGRIADGGAQWMTAGHGIVHSEMPRQEPGRELWGLQLWVNLPAARKLIKPRYQDLGASAIPELDVADARVRLVAGTIGATRGPVDGIDVQPTLLDAKLAAGARFRHPLPGGHTAFAWMLDGEARFGRRATPVRAGQLAVLSRGTELEATAPSGGRFLLIAGAPIGEPVARRGPFVMNTDSELQQAFADYRAGTLTRL
jgi:redox-sensitive bicupin YhaK (pirin superfamily)